MISAPELSALIAQFTGTEHHYYNPLFSKYRYTDGVKFVAEQAEAYWLIDAIFSHQVAAAQAIGSEFQVWRLVVFQDATAKLTCRADSDEPAVVSQRIPFTDFPPGEWYFWLENGVLLLPNEH